jgi:hypothetical protein
MRGVLAGHLAVVVSLSVCPSRELGVEQADLAVDEHFRAEVFLAIARDAGSGAGDFWMPGELEGLHERKHLLAR